MSRLIAKLLPIVLLLFGLNASAQVVKPDDIVKRPDIYIFAYGEGATDQEAISAANAAISREISATISSKFDYEFQKSGKKSDVNVTSAVESYSSNTLLDCHTLYISKRPGKIKVLQYMDRDDLNRVFEDRMTKAREMAEIASKAETELKIDDALRYYYWALLLVNTLPVPTDCTWYNEAEDKKCVLAGWIPGKIDSILSSLEARYEGRSKDDQNLAVLSFAYKGRNVASISYSCDLGGSWTDMISARNGLGTVDLTGYEDVPSIGVTIEYAFENMSANDIQVSHIFKHIQRPFFQKAALPRLNLKSGTIKKDLVQAHTAVDINPSAEAKPAAVKENKNLQKTVYKIADALREGKYDTVKPYFTENGFREYCLLMKYGNAKVIARPELRFVNYCDETYCRSVPMKFSFGGKDFIENVVFLFDKDQKVSSIAFAIEDETIRKITEYEWDDKAKVTLINFLEAYRTSFAMKDITYLESVFSEDALIIVGRVLQRVSSDNSLGNLSGNQIVYNRMNKNQYMSNLRTSFASKEYINIKFSNAEIGNYKKGTNDYIFGIQIKQDYYSSNYADSGYLYLLVDLEDKDRPMIHVRTWQPEPDPEFGLFGPNNI